MHVVLAAGGTAGHIEPALNVGDAISRLDPSVTMSVLDSERGLEGTLVPGRGFVLDVVPSVPLPRRPNGDLLMLGPRLTRSVRAASAVLSSRRADVVVGFGGYAAVPAYLAARRARIPIVIHESNARPGVANRLGARFTPYVFETYPGTIPGARQMAVPLRQAIALLDREATRDQARRHFGLAADRPTLLVFGGSQGAVRLNQVVQAAVPRLHAEGVQVLHSFGARNQPPAAMPGYMPLPYIDRMDLAYAAADLAMTRAGAMTCGELAAVGLPAIYVPLPIGNGEQRLNALPVVDAGGGFLVDDGDITAEWLTETVLGVLHDGTRLRSMSEAAYGYGVRDADEQLARVVLEAAAGGRA
jgi:UDP-N-acetylglucosamine--N-acetylmuramyl-(pentapeptide) pyrophosphoryl-undecaprenol N-acetylglucosamine transferase